LAPGAVILVHDVRTKKCLDYTKIGEVTIGNKTFIGANSVILPNANIGNNVIIGAGSVVTHDIPDGVVAVSNSAKIIKTKSEYVKLHEANLKTRLVYQNKRQQISDMLDEGIGYVNKWLFFGNRQCYNRFHTPRIFA
jgi:maltose O-acetyltransferase